MEYRHKINASEFFLLKIHEMSESNGLKLRQHNAKTSGEEVENTSKYPDTSSTQNSAIQMFVFPQPTRDD